MSIKTKIYRFLSIHVWGSLPSWLQREISRVYANIYNKQFTRHLIKPYCKINKIEKTYLNKFRPASGAEDYQSFQDFFIRVYNDPITIKSDKIWGCEGLLCDHVKVKDTSWIKIKNQIRDLKSIFGSIAKKIPDHYYFSNIFLHNSNYHRIHAPVSGKISRIEHIPGDLVLLRPWIYQKDPSLPALLNERVNIDIVNKEGKKWYLSIVGGPAVGTIVLSEAIHSGSSVQIGQEIATFLLGSTCCIASPEPVSQAQVGQQVEVELPY